MQNVQELVAWLLDGTKGWGPDHIEQAVQSGDQVNVNLTKPVPLHWVYVTAWSASDGIVQFREDIYSRDWVGDAGHSADGEALSRILHCSSQFCGLKHGATAASMFNYIVLKLLEFAVHVFFGRADRLACQGQSQDQLHVSQTHDVVRTCDEAGGYCAVCDRGDQHSRTLGATVGALGQRCQSQPARSMCFWPSITIPLSFLRARLRALH